MQKDPFSQRKNQATGENSQIWNIDELKNCSLIFWEMFEGNMVFKELLKIASILACSSHNVYLQWVNQMYLWFLISFKSPIIIFIYLTNKRNLFNWSKYVVPFRFQIKVHVGCLGILQNINVFTSSIIKTFFCKHVYSQKLCYQDNQLRTVIDWL